MKYKYKNNNFDNIFELAKAMYKDTSFFAKALKEEKLMKFISSNDENKAKEINKINKMILPDSVLVFKATYILNPYISFRFDNHIFETYKDLGNAMLIKSPQMDNTLLDVVSYSLIQEHMVSTNFSKDNKDVYEKLLQYQEISLDDLPYGYFTIAYFLSGKDNIIFNGVEYPDLYSFVYYLNRLDYDKSSLGELLSHSAVLKAYAKFGKEKNKVEEFIHLNSELEKSENSLKSFLDKFFNNS